MSEDAERLREARIITAEAAQLAGRYFDDLSQVRIEEKGVQDFVTQADHEVEALIRKRLDERFGGEGFIGEETGRTEGRGAWILDPIDGTANFMRGIPLFGVSLAYVDANQRAVVGIIEEVAAGRTYWAQRGRGAFVNDDRLTASTVDRLNRAAVAVGFWSKAPNQEAFLTAFRRFVDEKVDVRRFGAACMAMAYVASGKIEGFWQMRINSWDVAAGILLVREAGGTVTPFFDAGGLDGPIPMIASNGPLAPRLADILEFSQDG